MWTKSFGNWLKSGSEPRPLWRRDPGLNFFAGICKKPKLNDLRHLALFGAVAAVNAETVVRTREGTAVRGTAAHTSDLSSSKDAIRHPAKGQESRFRYSHFSASES